MLAVKADRPALLAANTTLEESMVGVPELHRSLRETFRRFLTVIAPKDVVHAKQIHAKLQTQGLMPVLWSQLSQVTFPHWFASDDNCMMRETRSSLLTVMAPKEVAHAKLVHASLQAQGLALILWSPVSKVTVYHCFASIENCMLRESCSILLTVIAPKKVAHAKQFHASLQVRDQAPILWSQLSQVILFAYDMLCYAMLCYATLRYATLCCC